MLSAANDVAREVAASSGETVSVALLERGDVSGLGKALLAYASPQSLAARFSDPDNLPRMTEHSIGTLTELEEELARIRDRGVAFENEESTPHIRCAAAPVRDGSGAVVAAISISVSTARWEQHPEDHWVDLVRNGAAHFSALLGFSA
jgi:DNA-binding IclR family transcriptional regulator